MRSIFLSISILFCCQISFGQTPGLPEGFTDEVIQTGLLHPMGFVFDDNGQMYFWERRGTIYTIDDQDVRSDAPFLDISEEVGSFGDHGLLSIAIHPDFLSNGYLYLYYIVDRHHLMNFGTSAYDPNASTLNEATIGRVTRYQLDINTNFKTIVPNSRKIILGETPDTGVPVMFISHAGGTLIFGTDKTLMLSTGDGTTYVGVFTGQGGDADYSPQGLNDGILSPSEDVGAYRSQLLNSYNGKILRFDAETGAGIPSNPYYDASQPFSPKSKVWALGFRNPFKMALLEGTGSHEPELANPGTLIIGDVGGSLWEEMDVCDGPGQNFGWPLYEGTTKQPAYFNVAPLNLDAPNPLNCGNTHFKFNELVLQEQEDPTTAFFGNPCDNSTPIPLDIPTYFHTRPAITWSNKLWNQPTRAKTGIFNEQGNATDISLDDENSPIKGPIFDGFSGMPGFVYKGEAIPEMFRDKFFIGDYSGWIRMVSFDDSEEITSIEPFHTQSGRLVHLEQNPNNGCIYYIHHDNHQMRRICFGGNSRPTAILDYDQQFGPSPLSVQFSASNSYDIQEDPLTFHWDFGDGITSTEESPSHIFTSENSVPKGYEVTLTVTDSAGASAQKTLMVSVDNTPPKIAITSFEDGDLFPPTLSFALALEAEVEDREHGPEELSYIWQTFLHHNTHFHEEESDSKPSTYAIISPVECETEIFYYKVRLTVTDAAGLSSQVESILYPYCGEPFGEVVALEGQAVTSAIDLTIQATFPDSIQEMWVEKSSTGFLFDPIKEYENSELQSGNAIYKLVDSSPINGTNFYRVKWISNSGLFDYSNIIGVTYPAPEAFSINPNPVSNFINASFSDQVSGAQFELFDLKGQLIISKVWQSEGAQNYSINTELLSSGVYTYRVINGNDTFVGKIYVQK